MEVRLLRLDKLVRQCNTQRLGISSAANFPDSSNCKSGNETHNDLIENAQSVRRTLQNYEKDLSGPMPAGL
jgi:hypothetical protein